MKYAFKNVNIWETIKKFRIWIISEGEEKKTGSQSGMQGTSKSLMIFKVNGGLMVFVILGLYPGKEVDTATRVNSSGLVLHMSRMKCSKSWKRMWGQYFCC